MLEQARHITSRHDTTVQVVSYGVVSKQVEFGRQSAKSKIFTYIMLPVITSMAMKLNA